MIQEQELGFRFGAIAPEKPQEPKNSVMDEMIAVSRSLAKAQISWTVEERKLFCAVLTKIRWSKGGNNNVIELDKAELVEALSLKLDASDRSRYLRDAFRKLARDSEIRWTDPEDKELWEDGFLIISRWSTRGSIFVEINPRYMIHLENLVKGLPFITVWSSDIYRFKSRHTMALFEALRLSYDSRYTTNYKTFTTHELKDIFGLSKDDYTRKDGSFARTNFEKWVLDVAIKEINESSKMMAIMPSGRNKKGDFAFYKKHKKNGYVSGYEFKFFVKTQLTSYDPNE